MKKKKFISTRDLPAFPTKPGAGPKKLKIVTVRSSVPGSSEIDIVETKDLKDPQLRVGKPRKEPYDGPPITTKDMNTKAEKEKNKEKPKAEKIEEPKKKTTRKRTTKKDEDKEEER